jgi:hypothetical protein
MWRIIYGTVRSCTVSKPIHLLGVSSHDRDTRPIRRTGFEHYNGNIYYNPRLLDVVFRELTLPHALNIRKPNWVL